MNMLQPTEKLLVKYVIMGPLRMDVGDQDLRVSQINKLIPVLVVFCNSNSTESFVYDNMLSLRVLA